VLHTADYALAWPKDLFLDEAQVLLWDRTDGPWIGRAEFLLEEAFIGPAPLDALRGASVPSAWDAGPRGVIEALMEQADQLEDVPLTVELGDGLHC
jgi:hypothetical protein